MIAPLLSRLTAAPVALALGPLLLAACTHSAPPVSAPEGAAVSAEVTEFAVACQHDAALAALDQVEAGMGGSTSATELQRVVLLRNAGRTMDAARVLRERNARDDVTVEAAVQSGTVVENELELIRSERAARTGSRSCG
ncbi:hypothetical protein [Alloyangia pacifica]|uniref:Lipoprotein n=1 Tax=Alloyangia pacifica TaxID=311180 RepID=A0A1I6W3E9_9RHOB|nr:hypothetical protein [Alloyangia pacifica]SDI39670.1 hypothetical protein SAMN04488245_11589 [Alloyangia pacifica]SFT20241.1 hypothetical protein SAMN04488050_11490 [Alloyangia pacifica]